MVDFLPGRVGVVKKIAHELDIHVSTSKFIESRRKNIVRNKFKIFK